MIKIRKRLLIALSVILATICTFLIVYPTIEYTKGNRLYVYQYSDDFGEFEENASFHEIYFYNEKRDISITDFKVKNFLFFFCLEMEYVKGDARKTMFVLEESYIQNWLKNAVITDNEHNVDLKQLIEGKTAVVSNKRYIVDYETKKAIYFSLDNREDEMYVFYVDDLLVIQVGSPDECPRYIAYK